MRKVACLGFGLFLLAVEASLFSFLPIELTKPDIGVPFIIYGTLFLSPLEGLVAALFFGFFQEVLSIGPPGALLFTNVGLLLSCLFLKSRLYIETKYTFSIVCAASVLVQGLIFLALSVLSKGETRNFHNVAIFSVPVAIVTGFISIFMFSFFERLKLRYLDRV